MMTSPNEIIEAAGEIIAARTKIERLKSELSAAKADYAQAEASFNEVMGARKPRKKARKVKAANGAGKAAATEGMIDIVDAFFDANTTQPFSAAEVAAHIGSEVQPVRVALNRLAKKDLSNVMRIQRGVFQARVAAQ